MEDKQQITLQQEDTLVENGWPAVFVEVIKCLMTHD